MMLPDRSYSVYALFLSAAQRSRPPTRPMSPSATSSSDPGIRCTPPASPLTCLAVPSDSLGRPVEALHCGPSTAFPPSRAPAVQPPAGDRCAPSALLDLPPCPTRCPHRHPE